MVHVPYRRCHGWLNSLFTAFKTHFINVMILVAVRLRFRLCQFNVIGTMMDWGRCPWLYIWLKHCATCWKVRIPIASLEFFIDIILLATLWPGVNSASNRNEYKKCVLGVKSGRCVGMKPLQLSCAHFLDVREPKTPRILRSCRGLYKDCITADSSGRVV
jgi:hypothetical protein